MSKITDYLKNAHIQMSIVTGISIIGLAYFSKRILPEPLSYLELAAPPFIMTIYESLLAKYKDKNYMRTWIWILAIFMATTLVIVLNM
jgi:hypothetical protein